MNKLSFPSKQVQYSSQATVLNHVPELHILQ